MAPGSSGPIMVTRTRFEKERGGLMVSPGRRSEECRVACGLQVTDGQYNVGEPGVTKVGNS